MKIELWKMDPGNHHFVKSIISSAIPAIGDTVVLSDDEVCQVHSAHWYFDGARAPSVVLMLK
jgi:hypothetical protein